MPEEKLAVSKFKTRIPLILALILTGADYLIAVFTQEMVYLSNDDGSLQAAFSGAWTENPYPVHQYINVVLSYPMTGLYKLFPGVQWWYVCSQIVVAFGIFLIHFCVFKLAQKNQFPIPFVIGIMLFLDIGFFVYPIGNIAFTIVPAILGAGIVAGLFWMARADSIKYKKWLITGIIVGYIILFSWRRQTGLALLFYILVAFLYYYISQSENRKKTLLKILVTAVGLFLITVSLTRINRMVQNNINGTDFVAFNSARGHFVDYPHVTYDEDPEFYEEIGWDRDTYNIANSWGLLDENITTESLSKIHANSEYTEDDEIQLLNDIFHDELCWPVLLFFAASFVFAAFFVIVYHKLKIICFFLANNIGTIILFLYQLSGGRMIYRSIYVMMLPAVVINLMLCLHHEIGKDKKIIRNSFKVITIILGAICVVPMFRGNFNKEYNESMANSRERYVTACEYVAEHSDNFYVSQGGIGDYIAPIPTSLKTPNLIKWGGARYYSGWYYAQLEDNGLSELTGDTFKKDNSYFISATNALSESYVDNGNDSFAWYYRYLKKDHGAIGFVQTDTIMDGAYVYHFVFEENADDYDYYYDIEDGITIRIE